MAVGRYKLVGVLWRDRAETVGAQGHCQRAMGTLGSRLAL